MKPPGRKRARSRAAAGPRGMARAGLSVIGQSCCGGAMLSSACARHLTVCRRSGFGLAAMRGAGAYSDPEVVGFGLVVVDDSRSFAGAASMLLERQGRRVIGVAGTSAEAVELVADLRPDVVLVDLMLGDESGLDLAQVLAGDGSGDAPVVILISAYPPADIAELIAASPAAGFLPKSELSSDAIGQIVASSGRLSPDGNLA